MKLVPTTIAATVARLIGVNDKPMNGVISEGPQRFSGVGWYAFRSMDDEGITVVQFAQVEDEAFIRLSDGIDRPARAYLSHKAFDLACIGRVFSAAEVDAMAGIGGRILA